MLTFAEEWLEAVGAASVIVGIEACVFSGCDCPEAAGAFAPGFGTGITSRIPESGSGFDSAAGAELAAPDSVAAGCAPPEASSVAASAGVCEGHCEGEFTGDGAEAAGATPFEDVADPCKG